MVLILVTCSHSLLVCLLSICMLVPSSIVMMLIYVVAAACFVSCMIVVGSLSVAQVVDSLFVGDCMSVATQQVDGLSVAVQVVGCLPGVVQVVGCLSCHASSWLLVCCRASSWLGGCLSYHAS